MRRSFVPKPAAAALALAAMAALLAVPQPARADGAGVGVARISFIQGAVAVQRGDSATPVAAVINAPVLGADYVTTGDGARAEVQFDARTMVRLDAGVQMRFTHLDTADRAMQLAEGTIELRLLRGTDGSSAVDTPSVSIRPRQTGIYRVTVTADGTTQVTVRAGEAQVVTPQGDRTLGAGRTLIAQGDAANPSLRVVDALAYDAFDAFNKQRDDRPERALAASGQPALDLQGVDDLDTYGRWVNDGSYGRVWLPSNVGPGWAPYRDGRWVWEDRFAWTWVGSEPWGWTPYHYGRWYRSASYGWCWYPPRELVPVWQPALVGFLTFGNGYGTGLGFGTLAWVPLAPFEPYRPWWSGYGSPVVNNITVVNVYGDGGHHRHHGHGDGDADVVRRMYKNSPYGLTGLPGKRFMLGSSDRPVAVQPSQVRHLEIVRGALPVVPTTAHLRFTDAPAARELVARPMQQPRTFAGNAVVARRVPFEQQRDAVAVAAHTTPSALPASAVLPNVHAALPKVPVSASPWKRFGEARAPEVIDGSAVRAATPAATGTTNATGAHTDPWSRFGDRRGIAAPAVRAADPATVPVVHDMAPATRSTLPAVRAMPSYGTTAPVRESAPVRPVTNDVAPVRAAPVYHAPAAPPPPAYHAPAAQPAPPQASQSHSAEGGGQRHAGTSHRPPN